MRSIPPECNRHTREIKARQDGLTPSGEGGFRQGTYPVWRETTMRAEGNTVLFSTLLVQTIEEDKRRNRFQWRELVCLQDAGVPAQRTPDHHGGRRVRRLHQHRALVQTAHLDPRDLATRAQSRHKHFRWNEMTRHGISRHRGVRPFQVAIATI